MDIKEIKQIVDIMKRSNLTEFEIEEKDLKLRICREGGNTPQTVAGVTAPPYPVVTSPVPVAPAPAAEASTAAPVPAQAKEEEGDFIVSPMVGTFYQAPSPDSSPFVENGTKVTAESVVCIIEAMKVMNEIHAETSGTILEILVENGDPIEYGQKLFKVKPV